MMGKWLEIACFRTSVIPIILLYLYFPASLDKRIEQLSPQSPNPTLSVWSRRRGSGNLREETVVSTPFSD